MNKWWEYDFKNKTWKLYFTKYYDDILVAKIEKDKNCEENEWCCTYLDDKFCDYEIGELTEIKELIEERIYDYYINESNYYLELAKSFKEE